MHLLLGNVLLLLAHVAFVLGWSLWVQRLPEPRRSRAYRSMLPRVICTLFLALAVYQSLLLLSRLVETTTRAGGLHTAGAADLDDFPQLGPRTPVGGGPQTLLPPNNGQNSAKD